MFDMILTRPMVLNGTSYSIGAPISVDLYKAADLLHFRFAKLTDPSDLGVIIDASNHVTDGAQFRLVTR